MLARILARSTRVGGRPTLPPGPNMERGIIMHLVELWCPKCDSRIIGEYEHEKEGIGYFVCDECGSVVRAWVSFKIVRLPFVNSDPELVE